MVPGGVANPSNVPQSDDDVIIASGDAQYTNTLLPGAPDNGGARGTTFLQGGQIDMINSGTAGTAGLLSNALVLVTNTAVATATMTSSGGSTNNGTIDVDANGQLAFSVVTGDAANPGLIEATNGGKLLIQTSPGATFSNFGTAIPGTPNVTGVLANGGSILVTAAMGSSPGYWGLFGGGAIEVNAPVQSGGTFDFIDGANDVLKLDQLPSFFGTVAEMGPGDVLDFGAVNLGTIVYDGTSLTLEGTTGNTLAVLNAPGIFSAATNATAGSGTFTVVNDGTTSVDGLFFMHAAGSGDQLMAAATFACFAAGTRIDTADGPVAIEKLQVGDCVRGVLSGRSQPIIWIGHRQVDCARHPTPRAAWPIRITAGAFGKGRPACDLWLSPDHAVYVDGVLIPIKYLVNGDTIAQVPCDSVTYYHIELPCHDVVMAEGLAAESYLAAADRSVFANHTGPVTLHPDFTSRVWEAEGCAELVVTGPVLDAVRARVDRIAKRRIVPSRRAA